MAGNETEINLRFKVNDDGSIVLDKIGKSIQKVEDNTTKMNSSLGIIKFDSIVNLSEKAFQLGERMYEVAKATASAINDIERSAKIANMTTSEYQKMAYAAKMSDVGIEEMSTGMKKLSINMDEAMKGTGDAASKFERIGISVLDSGGKMKGFNQILMEISDKFSTWEDGPRKIAIAVDLFGRSGERLVPYLNQGAAGIKKFYEEAEKLGIVLDEKMINAGSEMEEKFKRVESWWDSLKKKVVVSVYEMVTSTQTLIEQQQQLNEAIKSAGGLIPEEDEALLRRKKEFEDLAKAESQLVQSELEYQKAQARKQAPEDKRAGAERDIKMFREVNTQLLKDQESTLKRMVELQTQLNKSASEAIDIANRLGIGTKAALTQWIESDIVGEYEKLLGSKLFSGAEMEQFKERYTDALKGAMEGGWGSEYKQLEAAMKRIETMKVEDTSIEKTRIEFEKLQKTAQYLEKFTGQIKLDDEDVIRARNQIDDLRKELSSLVSESWNVRISVTGYGSTELPIMEKISQVTNAFQNMGSEVGNMVLSMNMEQLNAAIAQEKATIINAQSPALSRYGTSLTFSSRYWEKKDEEMIARSKANMAELERSKAMLAAGGAYAAAQAAPPAAAQMEGGGGYGGGGISVNIGVINVNGENAQAVAQDLDAQLADLYLRDRSKLKNAIEGSA